MKTNRGLVGLLTAFACASALAAGEIAVKTARPEKITEGDPLVNVGRATGSHTVSLSARVVGTLWARKGEEGEKVRKGDVLYRIEDTIYKANLQTARAEQAELEAKLTQAEIDAKRYTDSETKGGVSKADRDRAVLSRDVAKAKLEAAKAKVALCENDLSYCTIASPIDGVLGRYVADVGNNVGPESGALRDVICADPIDVTVAIPEQVLLWAFDSKTLRGNVRRRLLRSDGKEVAIDLVPYAIDNKVDSATGTVMARFRGKNPDGLVMPGAYVKLLLSEVYPTPKLVVPLSAVVFDGEDRYVYVVSAGKAVRRKIAMGSTVGNRVTVESGLKEDETVVISGTHKLVDGASVKER